MDLSLVLSLEYLLLSELISYCLIIQLMSFFQHSVMVTEATDFHLSISFDLEEQPTEFCSGIALQLRISQPILK